MHVKLSPHAITEPVLDLKSISDTVLLEIWVQLAKLKVRYHLGIMKDLQFLFVCWPCLTLSTSSGPYSS